MVVVEGVVIGGQRLGRRLGFPTANIDMSAYPAVENGVYRSKVIVRGAEYVAMTNIGVRPSVDGRQRLLETHLFGFRGLLYGLTLRVELYEKIREERRFESIAELREQIARDAEAIKGWSDRVER